MSPQTAPPVSEVAAERGAVLTQMSTIALALNRLDADLAHGNVVAARSVSVELRGELVALAQMFGLT